jgi:hypothetical protein
VKDKLEQEKHSLRQFGNLGLPLKFRKGDDESSDFRTLH